MQNANEKWVGIYGNAMSITDRTPTTYGKDITFRYPITVPFSGDKLKLTFDNFCGTDAVTVDKVVVALGTDMKRAASAPVSVTFGGKNGFTVEQGASVTSDELAYEVKSGDVLFVSFYAKGYIELRSGVVTLGPLSKGYYAYGDQTEMESFPLEVTRNTSVCYFLSDVSIRTEKKNSAIICYGDSITAQDWPDYFYLALKEKGIENRSVIRKATSGSRILRQYSCATYVSYGLKGDIRFPHEIPMVEGADTIIIQQGINDIIHPVGTQVNVYRPWSDLPTADELFNGLRYYIDEAKKMGLKVYVGTLLPIGKWRTYEPLREELKNDFNNRIRALTDVEGVIDFDKVVSDSQTPECFKSGFDSGDGLHPSKSAYKTMGELAAETVL